MSNPATGPSSPVEVTLADALRGNYFQARARARNGAGTSAWSPLSLPPFLFAAGSSPITQTSVITEATIFTEAGIDVAQASGGPFTESSVITNTSTITEAGVF
jgi:hypothetical protein